MYDPRPSSLTPAFLLGIALLLPVGATLLVAQTTPPAMPPSVESQDLALEDPVDAWDTVDQESDFERLERRAEERFAEDDLEAAIVLYRQLADRIALPEQKVRFLMTVAWIEHLMGEERGGGDLEALETLATALSVRPDHPFQAEFYNDRFRDLFLEAQRMALAERQSLASEALFRAADQMRQRNYEAARSLYDEALEYQKNLPDALYNRALVDLYLDRPDDALDGFQRLLTLAENPQNGIDDKMRALALTNLGYIYTTRQQNTEAAEVLEQATRLDPDYAPAWSNLGVARRRLGLKVDAATAFRRAHDLKPDDPGNMNNLGLAYLDAEDWIAAVALYKKATDLAPNNPGLWVNLGRAQTGMSNIEGAAESFERAILEDSGNREGYAASAAVYLARSANSRGDAAETLRQADRALGWNPSQPDAWTFRGLGLKALGRLDEAREALEKALGFNPALASSHNNLGSVLYELGDLDGAEASFQRAVDLDSGFANAQQNLRAVRQARSNPQGTTAALPGTRTRTAPPPRAAPPPPPPPPTLGVAFKDIDYSALGLAGVMIETVEEGSSAAGAGLQAGDLLLKIDGVEITNETALRTYIAGRDPGSTVVIDLLRSNLPTQIEVKL